MKDKSGSDHDMSFLRRADNTIAQRCIHEEMIKSGSDQRRYHIGGQSLLFDGIQAFIQWKKCASTACDSSAEDWTKNWDAEITSGNGTAGSSCELDYHHGPCDFIQENHDSLRYSREELRDRTNNRILQWQHLAYPLTLKTPESFITSRRIGMYWWSKKETKIARGYAS
jgi:hypothetical protein